MILPLSFVVTQLHAVEGAGHHVTLREVRPPQLPSNAPPAPQAPLSEFTLAVEPFVFVELRLGQEFGLADLGQKAQQTAQTLGDVIQGKTLGGPLGSAQYIPPRY